MWQKNSEMGKSIDEANENLFTLNMYFEGLYLESLLYGNFLIRL